MPDVDVEEERAACEPPEGFYALRADGTDGLSAEAALSYLFGRGLSPERIREAGIGHVVAGRFAGRVVVPIFTEDGGDWLGWSARAVDPREPRKYLYPRGMRRAEIVYRQVALAVETEVPVYVVEGVFDAIALWPDAVALLGKPSPQQVEALALARRPVVVTLDGDAWIEGAALALRLRFDGARAASVRLDPGVDPDEVSRAELDRRAEWALAVLP